MSEYTEYVRSRVRVVCVWAGRNRRHYCPDCNPKPGHRMRLVRGDERDHLDTLGGESDE